LLMVIRTGSGVARCDQTVVVSLGVTRSRPMTKTLRRRSPEDGKSVIN